LNLVISVTMEMVRSQSVDGDEENAGRFGCLMCGLRTDG
jgi:hypothetical protein